MSLCTFIYFFIKTYVVGTCLNFLNKLRQYKWVPTTYVFIKKIRRKKYKELLLKFMVHLNPNMWKQAEEWELPSLFCSVWVVHFCMWCTVLPYSIILLTIIGIFRKATELLTEHIQKTKGPHATGRSPEWYSHCRHADVMQHFSNPVIATTVAKSGSPRTS